MPLKLLSQLKCSRERPVCLRCNRLQTACTYPELVDRRRAGRTPRSHRRASNPAPGDATVESTGDTDAQIATSAPLTGSSLADDSLLSGRLAADAGQTPSDTIVDMPSDVCIRVY